MKVAFFLGGFPELSETFISNQIIGLLERGVDVEVFATPTNSDEIHPSVRSSGILKRTFYRHGDSGGRLRRFGRAIPTLARTWRHPELLSSINWVQYGRDAASLRLLVATAQFLEHRDHDVIHCHFGPMGLLGFKVRQVLELRGRLVTSFYGYDLTRYVRKRGSDVYEQLFARGDCFLPVSDSFRDELVVLGCPPEKVRTHHLGVDCSRLTFLPRPSKSSRIHLLSVARLTEKKGLDTAIRAVGQLERAGLDVRYRIIGDGPLKGSLLRLIEDNGSRSIRLSGWQTESEVVAALYNADLLLAPSVTASDGDQEGTPVALMEAMATGLPVIASRHSGIPELIEHGLSGMLVDEKDEKGLAGTIARLIADPSLRSLLAQNGRKVVEDRFNIDRLSDQLIDIYEQTM